MNNDIKQLQNIQLQLQMKNQHLIKYKNPVILKDQEGKVKQTIYDLPPQSHTYGKKVVDDPEPVKYVVNGWKESEQSQKPPSKIKHFQQLNRLAIKSNLHTAKEQTGFRQTHDLMVNIPQGKKVYPIMLPEQQFAYGVPNRPSTPVKLVIGNCFALESEHNNQEQYLGETQKLDSQNSSKLQAKKTKSQALRQQKVNKQKEYRAKPNIQQKFKLSKYSSIKVTKVDTGLKSKGTQVQQKKV